MRISFLYIILFISLTFSSGCSFFDTLGKPSCDDIGEPRFRQDGLLQFKTKDSVTISEIRIEAAQTREQTSQGLMCRKTLDKDAGMLFVFDDLKVRNFYMLNTYIPLDIIFADTRHRIIKIHKRTKPLTTDHLSSGRSAKYTVEVNAGYCDSMKVKEGDIISFSIK